ncbi:MAG: DNA polymerase IV [Thermoanaerobaculia bacterium]|nr:DNA polymerase IV [Thermoanaerobaculia bacterium]
MRDDPTLRGKPVVVGGSPTGRGVVAAASYEARAFGIRSAMPAAQAVRLCPDTIFLKSDFSRYREESSHVFDIFHRFTDVVQPASLDEAYLDLTDDLVPYRSATHVAQEIRRMVLRERGLTLSIGVAPNRLVAKIASDYHKPDGLTVVRPHQVLDFLEPLSVRRVHGVGPATAERLGRLGVETIGDLRRLDPETLTARFGRHGRGLHDYARGIDDRPVRTQRERKSLGHERTYSRDLRTLAEMDEQIEWLSQRVAHGLEKRELVARTITVKVRYGDFTTLTRSKTLAEPPMTADHIASLGRALLRQTDAGDRSVRLLGVTASGLDRDAMVQLELFDRP